MNGHSTPAPIRAVPGDGLFATFVLAVLALRPLIASEDAIARDGLLDAGGVLNLTFAAVAGLWLIARWSNRGLRVSPLPATVAALAAVAVLSAANSCCPLLTLGGSLRLLSFALLLVVLEQLAAEDARFAPRALTVALLAAVPSLLVAYWQRLSGPDAGAETGLFRVTGLFSHPNLLAIHLVMLMLLCVALLPRVSRQVRAALVLYMVAAGGVLFLTYSRTSWLVLMGGLLFIGVVQYRWLLAALMVVVPVLILAVPGVASRFADVNVDFVQAQLPLTPSSNVDPTNTFEWRVAYWGQLLPLADGRELTGIGFETVAERRPEDFPPHNEFVRAYVEMGLFGLAALLAVVVACARTVAAGLRTAHPGLERGYAVAFGAATLALAIRLPVENLLGDVPNLWLFAALAAPVLGRLAGAFTPWPTRGGGGVFPAQFGDAFDASRHPPPPDTARPQGRLR